MVGCIVFHSTFGSGTIISKTANLLVIDFNGTGAISTSHVATNF